MYIDFLSNILFATFIFQEEVSDVRYKKCRIISKNSDATHNLLTALSYL